MPVIINASTSAGAQIIPDNSGVLQFQSNGANTTSIAANGTLTSSNLTTTGRVTAGNVTLSAGGLITFADATTLSTAPALGAWVEIAATTISSPVATVDFTNLSAYASLRLTMNLVRPVNDNASFQMRLSSDNGATFIATSSYVTNGATAAAQWTLSDSTNDGVSNLTTDSGFSGAFEINNFNIAEKTTGDGWSIYFREGTNYSTPTLMHNTRTAMNAIRFLFSSGNVAVGNFLLEGWTGS